MSFRKTTPTYLTFVITLCVLTYFLWAISVFVVSPPETPTKIIYLALVSCVPLATFFPRCAAISYLLLLAYIAFRGLNPGFLILTSVVLLAITIAQRRSVTGAIFAALIVLLGFYSPEHHRFEGDPESIIAFTSMLALAALIGWWVDNSHTQQRKSEEISRQRRRELSALLHDTVAADLTSLTVRLEALAITTPDRVSQLQKCAQLARKAMAETRTLLEELHEPIEPTSRHPVPSLDESLYEITELLRLHNFDVQTTTELKHMPSQKYVTRALHECLHEAAINAIKYSTPCSTILLTAFSDSKRIEIAMSNVCSSDRIFDNSSKLGLESIRKKLSAVNGIINIRQTNNRWTITFVIEQDIV